MNNWKLTSKKMGSKLPTGIEKIWVFKPSADEITKITQDLQMSIALIKCGVVTRGSTTYCLEEIIK